MYMQKSWFSSNLALSQFPSTGRLSWLFLTKALLIIIHELTDTYTRLVIALIDRGRSHDAPPTRDHDQFCILGSRVLIAYCVIRIRFSDSA